MNKCKSKDSYVKWPSYESFVAFKKRKTYVIHELEKSKGSFLRKKLKVGHVKKNLLEDIKTFLYRQGVHNK